MVSSASSSLLVSVQLSVFSSWRLAQIAKIARKARIVATTTRAMTVLRRVMSGDLQVIEQAGAARELHGGPAGRHAELAVDAPGVRLDGVRGDVEPFGDL